MYFTPESYAAWARWHHIPVASEATRNYLTTQVEAYHPRCILEVWAAIGSTTCRLWAQCASWQWQVVAYEVSYPSYQLARRRRNYRSCRNVHLFHADITEIDISTRFQEQIDFVFIDGMKAQYAQYLQQIRPYCRSGTCIIVDDVRAYVDKMDAFWQYLDQELLCRELIDLDDGDGVVKIVL